MTYSTRKINYGDFKKIKIKRRSPQTLKGEQNEKELNNCGKN